MNPRILKEKLIERDGLVCSLTGEAVENPDDLKVEHVIPLSMGGEDTLENSVLVKKDLNVSFSNIANRRTQKLISQLNNREKELILREEQAYEREKSYRDQLEQQKKELNDYREQLNRQQLESEKKYHEDLEYQKHMIRDRERKIRASERQLAKKMQAQNEELEMLQATLKQDIEARETALAESIKKFEKEKLLYSEESRKNITKKSNEYVNEALKLLESKENKYHTISRLWSAVGGISIVLGIAVMLYFGQEGMDLIEKNKDIGWSYLLLVTFKGLIIVALFVALAKYSFTFSQSYMHESIKNSERRHAINFGKFYLESYGADADWEKIKDAFEHWNIASESAFCDQTSSTFDQKTIESAVSLVDAVSKLNQGK